MSKATSKIGGIAPQRDKEMKDKEDYATQNYPDKDMPLSNKALREAKLIQEQKDKEEKEAESKEVKNYNVNFISDKDFKAELDYFPFTPQGESVIVLGPKVKVSQSIKENAIKLDEDTKRKLLADELSRHQAGYRVVAISPTVAVQLLEQGDKIAKALGVEFGSDLGEQLFYHPGAYVFSKPGPNGLQVVREIIQFKPLNEELSYYQVFHREIDGFMTQEQVLKFKPVEEVTKAKDESQD